MPPRMNFLKTFGGRKGANIGPSKVCMYIRGEKPYGDNPHCGKPAVEGCSYCKRHKKICFVEMTDRESRGFFRHTEYVAKLAR